MSAAILLLLPTTSSSRGRRPHHLGFGPVSVLPAVHAGTVRWEYWHTVGGRIEDAHNRPVRISGLNWSGFETRNGVVGGLEQQDYRAILHTIRLNGYNTVRIPFSNEMIESPIVPEHVAFAGARGPINEDLRGLDSIEILDRIITAAGQEGLKVILDDHRSEAGSSAEESGLWYTDRYPEIAWIADWVMLARRYRGDATVIGVDLRNEPHNAGKGGACWDCGGSTDWHRAAERAGDAVLSANPHLLIFVEGVDEYAGSTTWWGGNLAGVHQSPVHLRTPGRLVYSAHVYGPAEYQQPWFNAGTSPSSLASLWRHDWAFISESGIAPVWIGEFGTPNEDGDVHSSLAGSEGQWFAALVGYLQAHPAIGWTYWGVNGEDRYALLSSDYGNQPANASKALALASISATLPGDSGVVLRSKAVSNGTAERSQAELAAKQPNSVMTVVPVTALPSAFAASTMRQEQQAQARQQVARSWRIAAAPVRSQGPNGFAPAVLPSAAAPEVEDAVARQIRRATSTALHDLGAGR